MVVLKKEDVSIFTVLQKVLLCFKAPFKERVPTFEDAGRKTAFVCLGKHFLELTVPPLACSFVKRLHYQAIVLKVQPIYFLQYTISHDVLLSW